MDGVDAALVSVWGTGLDLTVALENTASAPLQKVDLLRRLADGHPVTAAEVLEARASVSASVLAALEGLRMGAVPDLIVVHGQTVFHRPPMSWQLLDPWPVAAAYRAPLLFDLRGADLARGGQGAPITPIADAVLFKDTDRNRAVVNLGGFVNITHLPRGMAVDAVKGWDVCPCNHLLDSLARERLGSPFDDGGSAALRGAVVETIAARLTEAIRETTGRSLGTDDECSRLVLVETASLPPMDACATAASAIARCITKAAEGADEVVLAGGSVRHARLVAEIRDRCGVRVVLSDELGVPTQSRESMCLAVLGALAMDGVPIHLPSVTGARDTLSAGAWIRP